MIARPEDITSDTVDSPLKILRMTKLYRRRAVLEGVDLEKVTDELRAMCGSCVGGAVVGRRRLHDAVGEQLHCSPLEAKASGHVAACHFASREVAAA